MGPELPRDLPYWVAPRKSQTDLGVAGALALTRLMTTMLYDVKYNLLHGGTYGTE